MKNKTPTNNKILKFEEMNWKQIDTLDRDKTFFFIPLSPPEAHGPHLPIGTDILTTKDAAIEAIKILNKKNPDINYVLYPIIPLGYIKLLSDFPGSCSIDVKVVKNIIIGIGSSLAKFGFKYVVICSYHQSLGHLKGIYKGMKKLESRYHMKICEPWGPYFYNKDVEKHEPKLGFDTKKELHAGFRETSLMKYQYPYLVDESYKGLQSIYRDLASPRSVGKTFKQLGLKDGYIGSPARADADYGRWFFNETVNTYVNAADALFNGKKLADLPQNIKLIMKSMFWR